MNKAHSFFKRLYGTISVSLAIVILTGGIELWMGRSLLGPDGKFGWWEGDIWSSENSQRFFDPYSFSHIVHGILFYVFLWFIARRIPLQYRLLIALVVEAAWELMENSPFIIDRYRAVTISLGYTGDSILNSMSDVIMMAIGFLFAHCTKPWIAAAAVVAMEVGCALWIRDNLTLNILMLIHPIEAVKHWQMAIAPVRGI